MLQVGDELPEFRAADAQGRLVDRASLIGHPGVLFFYPKAGSLGCTREAKAFADDFETFQHRDVRVIGISVDPATAQQRFAEQCHLPYPLVADPSREVARLFGVLGPFGFARRVTFVYDAAGRIRRVVESPLPKAHVRAALEALEGLSRPSP